MHLTEDCCLVRSTYRLCARLQVYMHQSSQYLVRRLDLERGEALAEPANKINYYTESKEMTEISVVEQLKMETVGATRVCQGKVRVSAKVKSL